jgi:hypothetical protein
MKLIAGSSGIFLFQTSKRALAILKGEGGHSGTPSFTFRPQGVE